MTNEELFKAIDEALYSQFTLESLSNSSEARYYSDGGCNRIRLAMHDIVHDDGEIAVNIVIGGQESDYPIDPSGLDVADLIAFCEKRLDLWGIDFEGEALIDADLVKKYDIKLPGYYKLTDDGLGYELDEDLYDEIKKTDK